MESTIAGEGRDNTETEKGMVTVDNAAPEEEEDTKLPASPSASTLNANFGDAFPISEDRLKRLKENMKDGEETELNENKYVLEAFSVFTPDCKYYLKQREFYSYGFSGAFSSMAVANDGYSLFHSLVSVLGKDQLKTVIQDVDSTTSYLVHLKKILNNYGTGLIEE